MEKITLTREMIEAAADYVPLAEKEAWIENIAPKCFDRLAITADGETMPPMYMINEGLQSRYVMAALVKMYFKQTYNADVSDAELMTFEEYDKWAGSHILGQIDRWKHDRELRDKCFDLLDDYYDLKKRLRSQINGRLAAMNDSVVRQSQYMTEQMKELPQVIEQLKELQGKADGENAG